MSQERLNFCLSQELHPLFSQGTLVHVTDVGVLESCLLGEGLLSPCQKAEREGKTISEDTMWHPKDNFYVKFLRLPGADYRETCLKLIGHFSQFADPEYDLPIGLMVRDNQAVLMFEQHPIWKDGGDYYGIEGSVPPQNIEGVIIFTTLYPEDTPDWLQSSRGSFITDLVCKIVHRAEEEQKRKIPILDNFGRELLQEE